MNIPTPPMTLPALTTSLEQQRSRQLVEGIAAMCNSRQSASTKPKTLKELLESRKRKSGGVSAMLEGLYDADMD